MSRRRLLLALLALLAGVLAVTMCEPVLLKNETAPDLPLRTDPAAEPVTGEEPARRQRARADPDQEFPTDVPSPTAEPATTWSILVLGPGDVPIPGVAIEVTEETPEPDGSVLEGQSSWVTDARGLVHAEPLRAGSTGSVRSDELEAGPVPYEQTTVLRIDDALPVTVAPVDGWTGEPLDVDVELLRSGAPIVLSRRGSLRVLPAGPARPGHRTRLVLLSAPAAGHEGPLRTVANGGVSALASGLHVTAAIPRAIPLTARISDAAGAPVADAAPLGLWRNEDSFFWETDEASGADGLLPVAGVPFFRGERVALVVQKGDLWARSETITLDDPDVAIEVPIRLPTRAPEAGPWEELQIEDAYESASYRGPPRWHEEDGAASLRVHVTTRHGQRRGIDVTVLTHAQPGDQQWTVRTDAAGVATFPGLPPGSFQVIATDPGMTEARAGIELGPGEQRRLDVREPASQARTIRVVDHDGAAIPFAQLSLYREVDGLGSVSVAHLVDGVQHLPIVTDVLGVLHLARAPPGSLRVLARYGRRWQSTTGDASEIVIRLPVQ